MGIQDKDKIGLIGFNESEQTMLELFFNGRQQKLFTLTSPETANALLIDLSSAAGELRYLKYQRLNPASADLPGIALINGNDAPDGYLALKRPLTLTAISDSLEMLSKHLQAPSEVPIVSAADRDLVFAEWQARKQSGIEAMQKWNQGKQLQDEGRNVFPLDRHGVQEVISKAHLVMAHRRHEVTPGDPALAVVDLEEASHQPDNIPAVKTKAEPETQKTEAETEKKEPGKEKIKSVAGVLRKHKKQHEISKPKVTERVHDYCGYLPDQDLSENSGLRRVQFNLERSLLPWIEQAVRTGRQSEQAQQVSGLPGVLMYLPALDSFFCDMNEDLLLHMARAKFGLGELFVTAYEPSDAVKNETVRHISADQLLWKLALLTSRGRIPETLDLNQPIQLTRKPDFTYFEAIPHARTLAELWYSKRLSPIQMLSESAVSQRYVFTFLVAADAVGYFNP